MHDKDHLYTDATLADFSEEVIGASTKQLVLVDFWAAWCGPCKSLAPILERLVDEYSGAIKLVKVDTDSEQELAAQFGIRSLPTVIFFKNENVVDQFSGVQPESAIRALIDKYAESALDKVLDAATALYQEGDTTNAKERVRDLIQEFSQDDKPKLVLLKWLADEKRNEEASSIAATVSSRGRDTAEFRSISASLELLRGSEDIYDTSLLTDKLNRDPDDLQIRFQLAKRLIGQQQFADGMDHLIEIIRRDRAFDDDAARKTMLKVFEALGGKGELVSQYRKKLSSVLF